VKKAEGAGVSCYGWILAAARQFLKDWPGGLREKWICSGNTIHEMEPRWAAQICNQGFEPMHLPLTHRPNFGNVLAGKKVGEGIEALGVSKADAAVSKRKRGRGPFHDPSMTWIGRDWAMGESPLNNKRILAVDDEPDVLELLAEQLEDFEGIILDTATGYQQAYHLIRSWSYDLVILDIMGVRGFDLLNASVSLGFPTIMLTAHALSAEALKKSIEIGARAYIPKDKLADIVPFLEDVLTLSHKPGWQRLFKRLGGFFDRTFGSEWQKDEKTFWEEVQSGHYEPKPLIFRK